MNDLRLDDIGLILLSHLSEAWEASESYAQASAGHQYLVTSLNELWQRSAEYDAALAAYTDHLRFIARNPGYAVRLVYTLSSPGDVNIMEQDGYGETDDVSDRNYIGRLSVMAYRHNRLRTENSVR